MAGSNGRQNFYLRQGSAQRFLGIDFSFGKILPGHVCFTLQDGQLMMQSPTNGTYMRMADQFTGEVQKDITAATVTLTIPNNGTKYSYTYIL